MYRRALTRSRGKCNDLRFVIRLNKNRNISVYPVNGDRSYNDFLTFSFHDNSTYLKVNNAICQLKLSGVSNMPRNRKQNLKPRVIKGVIQHAKSHHVAYIDWDANFIRRPKYKSGLVVQAGPILNVTNTGTLVFLQARKHLRLLDRWISHEKNTSADQNSWRSMELESKVHLYRTQDGDIAENYNWNSVGRKRTTRRCRTVIWLLIRFRLLCNLYLIWAVLAKCYDVWSMNTVGYYPRRLFLCVMLVFAVVCSVFFKENYHYQAEITVPYMSERICAIPELGILLDGSLITRRWTTPGPSWFLRKGIEAIGIRAVATWLSFWYTLLAKLRLFACIVICVEILSVISSLMVSRRSRPESLIWSLLIQWGNMDVNVPYREHIAEHRMNGKVDVGLAKVVDATK